MTVHFLTGNPGKLKEIQAIIPEVVGMDIDLPEIQHSDATKIIQAKLTEARQHHSGAFIVEDTSLYLDALNGLPGPLIKWFLKAMGVEGLHRIAASLENTTAQAKTIIGYATPDGKTNFFEGIIEGTIVAPRGTNGFGWDAIFLPNGHERTFAEMDDEEKNTLSMRRLAAQKLQEYLQQ